MIIVSDYEFAFQDGKWFASIPWGQSFFDLYKKKVDKIVLVGRVCDSPNFSKLIPVDQELFEVFIINNKLAELIWNKELEIRIREADIILFKMFYLNSIFVFFRYFHLLRKKCTACQLVGDSEAAFNLRDDLIRNRLLRALVGKLIFHFNRWFLARVDVPCVVSDKLKAKYSISKTKSMIVSNESWLSDDDIQTRRVFDGRLSLLFVGRLIKLKGLSDLLNALGKLRHSRRQFSLTIVGDGPEVSALKQLAEELMISENVSFEGWLTSGSKELKACYRAHNFFLFPSYSEGLPLVILEAMANSQLVCSSDVGGIPELIEHAETGFLFQPGDVDGIVHCLEKLASLDAETFNSMVDRGLVIARSNTFLVARGKLAEAILKALNSIHE